MVSLCFLQGHGVDPQLGNWIQMLKICFGQKLKEKEITFVDVLLFLSDHEWVKKLKITPEENKKIITGDGYLAD